MLDYARQRVREALRSARSAVLVSSGPAGVQAGEFPCEALDLELFLLVPATSDHLFNLEHDPGVTLLADGWELKGIAQVLPCEPYRRKLSLYQDPGAEWCALVKTNPCLLHFRRKNGWENLETIELNP